ncbi:MAG: hypothetical protein EPN37_04180 [Chitinophagaceae bacterium]|nr:MAG: hypothetical protein EPN37_04180 [Chitinophagaceae bacterium]
MKKIMVFLLAGVSLANSAHGQLAKGTWMIGGNAVITTYNTHAPVGTQNETSVSITPAIGYFVIEKFVLGINPRYTLDVSKFNDIRYVTLHSYALGPFVRYYLLPVDHIVNLFTGGSYQYSIGEPGNSITNNYSFFIGATAFFNSSAAIEITTGFSSTLDKGFSINSFVINAGFQIYLKKQ